LYDKSSAPGNYLLTHSLTYLLTHSLTHSYSLTHLLLLTHSLTLTDSLPSYAGIVKQSLFNLAKCIAGISVHSINTIIDRLTTDLKSTHSLTYSLLLTHSLTHSLTYSLTHSGILQSIARIEKQGYDALTRLGASPVTEVYSSGGGSKNEMWTRMRQRILGVPTNVSTNVEAAYGSALLAKKYL